TGLRNMWLRQVIPLHPSRTKYQPWQGGECAHAALPWHQRRQFANRDESSVTFAYEVRRKTPMVWDLLHPVGSPPAYRVVHCGHQQERIDRFVEHGRKILHIN